MTTPPSSPPSGAALASTPGADSQAYLEALLHTSPDGIMAFASVRDAAGRVIDFRWTLVNPQAGRITGHDPAQLVGARLLDVFPGNRDTGLFDAYANVVETGAPFTSEFFYDHDGLRTWFQNTAVRLGDGFFVTFRDISSQRAMIAAAEESRDLLDSILRTSLDAVVVLKPVQDATGKVEDFVFTVLNPQAEALIPHDPSRASLVGARLLEALPGNRDTGLFDAYARVVETGAPFEETVHYPHDGVDLWVHIAAVRVPMGVAVTFRDVTQAKRAEEAVRASEERFRLLAETSLDIVTEHAADGTPLYVSPAIERMLGYAPEEVVGHDNHHLIHPDDARALQEAEAAREGAPPTEFTIQYRVRHKDGHYVWLELSGRAVLNDDGSPRGMITTARDISDRKEVETELELRNRELQEFAYAASHDLQEPLRKIRAFADLLVTDHRDVLPDEARGYLDRIQAATTRMSGFIRDLLALSRVVTRGNTFEPVEPGRLLAEVLSDLEIILHETDARIDAEALPTLEADPMQIRQLFQNLIGNAVKFHRVGVRPHVQVRGRVERAGQPDERVVFEVQDNGIGFEERFLDRIFTPFQRLHARERYEGSGVGLAICRRIAERHGGSLSARSVPGEGSTFIATFPRSPHEPAPAEISASAP